MPADLDAGTTALVVNVDPILIAVLAGFYLREGFPRGLVTGLVIAFSGVATIATATSTGRHDALGVLLALGAIGGALCLLGVAVTRLPPSAFARLLGTGAGRR